MRAAPLLTDLGYLVLAAFPRAARWLGPYFRWRYGRLAASYEYSTVRAVPAYGDALSAGLQRCTLAPRACADIAAGTGAASRAIRTRYPDARLVAVDYSPAMLAAWTGRGALRVAGAGWALPLAGGAVDLAVVQNAPPFFEELARIVRPGGSVLFSLTTGAAIPARLRRWLVRKATPRALSAVEEAVTGPGVTWVFQRRLPTPAGPQRARSDGQSWPAANADRDC